MLPVGFQRLLGKDGRGLWSFLSAEVGGRQVRADLVRFLPPSTLGGWAEFLASLGRPGLPLGNIQEPQAMCPGLCVPCQQCQAVFQCQPHLCSRIASQLSENSHARAHLSPVQAIDSPAEAWVGRHCCQSSASVCKFLNVCSPLTSVVLILTLPGCASYPRLYRRGLKQQRGLASCPWSHS